MIDIVLKELTAVDDGVPPTHEFIEAERNGKSVEGSWVRRDPYWVLSFSDMVTDVKSFHEKFSINYTGKPRALDFELMQFRLKFLREEMTEYEKHADAAAFELDKLTRAPVYQTGEFEYKPETLNYHLAGMIDALADLVYVALGTAHLQGFDFEKAWEKVHEANMAKKRPAGEACNAEERIKLKMIKPPGWTPPDHLPEVIDNAHVGQKSRP